MSRLERTLRAAVHEVHVDVSVFKQRTERRTAEACRAATQPLGQEVQRLTEENRQLRERLDALERLVDGLLVAMGTQGKVRIGDY